MRDVPVVGRGFQNNADKLTHCTCDNKKMSELQLHNTAYNNLPLLWFQKPFHSF